MTITTIEKFGLIIEGCILSLVLSIAIAMVLFGVAALSLGDGVTGYNEDFYALEREAVIKAANIENDVKIYHRQKREYKFCGKSWIDILTHSETCR